MQNIDSNFEILKTLNIPPNTQICGIDEAGRGCLAGSLFVCGVVLDKLPSSLKNSLKDSKTLSQKKRDILADSLKNYAEFKIIKKEASEIDAKGLSYCIKEALQEILSTLYAPFYIFDGNCNFKISHLKTLIKGDSKLYTISAASILAKSAKDAEMLALDALFPHYNFAHNKGYGTKAHINAIKCYGLCKAHRKSYQIKSLNVATLF